MIERTARVLAPAALTVFVVIGAVQSHRHAVTVVVAAVATAAAGVAITRLELTGWTLIAALTLPTIGVLVICYPNAGNLGWFATCVIAGWAAIRAAITPALTASAALIGMLVAQWVAHGQEAVAGAWIAGIAFTTLVCVFARQQHELVKQLREAQAGLAARARAEERNRVAREMHDVIGHALTVALLHLSSARLAISDDPRESHDALLQAERLARQSLDEVRSTVGLLRTSDTDEVRPIPSGTSVPDLVESFRQAGTSVGLVIRGDLDILGAAHGLAVYRIVQESLTNAMRHGDGSPVCVRVDIEGGDITVTITSGGSPGLRGSEGSGLIGMRERAEALGGYLRAGPVDQGWRTEAVLPA